MVLIEWKETHSVGVKEIDEQHKKLIGCINKLTEAMMQGKAINVVGDVLKKLIDYTEYHFKTEEDYFEKFKYKDAEEHINEHRKLKKEVFKYLNDFNEGKLGVSFELLRFLKRFLEDHLINQDQKFVECFKHHGLK